MPSNLNTDSSYAEQNAEQSKTMDVQTAQRVEQERVTRRATLRKLGFGAGLAAFSLLGVDDFARMVGQRMERMANDNKVACQVAKEFQSAGITMADGTSAANCADCCNHYQNSLDLCESQWCYCQNHPTAPNCSTADADYQTCKNNAAYAYGSPQGCFDTWCQPIGMTCGPYTIPTCTAPIAG